MDIPETPTMRGRLIRILAAEDPRNPWDGPEPVIAPHYSTMVGAIFTELDAMAYKPPHPCHGVYVNGEKWAECDDPARAEQIMDALAAVLKDDPTASFDVVKED